MSSRSFDWNEELLRRLPNLWSFLDVGFEAINGVRCVINRSKGSVGFDQTVDPLHKMSVPLLMLVFYVACRWIIDTILVAIRSRPLELT